MVTFNKTLPAALALSVGTRKLNTLKARFGETAADGLPSISFSATVDQANNWLKAITTRLEQCESSKFCPLTTQAPAPTAVQATPPTTAPVTAPPAKAKVDLKQLALAAFGEEEVLAIFSHNDEVTAESILIRKLHLTGVGSLVDDFPTVPLAAAWGQPMEPHGFARISHGATLDRARSYLAKHHAA